MNKKERREYIRKTAIEMAESGKYTNFMSIESALRADGFHEARSILDSRFTRQELNQLCKEAQSKTKTK